MRRISVLTTCATISLASFAQAEVLMVSDCDGLRGIGVMAYAVTKGMSVEASTELSEVCWNQDTATFTSQEISRDLELTQDRGDLKMYQRLNGGSVSPLNEQFQVGPWEGHGGGTMPHFRWTTESSRSSEEINGADFVTTEGFLLTEAGHTPKPAIAEYPLDMVLTAKAGSLSGMVYNIFLPMQATLNLDGDTFTFDLTTYQQGMGPGNVTLDMTLNESEFGYDGGGVITMENALMAGGADMFWKTIELRLEEFAPQFSGNEIAVVANFVGEAVTFGGESQVVKFSLIGTGVAN
ncbi:hypothetical protein AAFO92_15745 [Roseovarius sp. CAU 1744]|uniref:hypothetical protein n=1 Tax=Roseovarius sp. CAU 1744 TaxID=3140368 RepID=UPI00325BA853